MKIQLLPLFLSACLGVTALSAAAEPEQTDSKSPYVLLGCKLDSSGEFPEYKTSSITYGYYQGTFPRGAHISCGQNLEYSKNSYDILNVTAVGDEIVYTLKYKL